MSTNSTNLNVTFTNNDYKNIGLSNEGYLSGFLNMYIAQNMLLCGLRKLCVMIYHDDSNWDIYIQKHCLQW